MAEVARTVIDERAPCAWAAPDFPILTEAWTDLLEEFEPWILWHRDSRTPWTIKFRGGGKLECWSFEQKRIARSRKYRKFIIDEAGLVSNLAARYDAEADPTLIDYEGSLVTASTPNLVGPDFLKWYHLGQQRVGGWRSWKWSSFDNPAVRSQAFAKLTAMRDRGVPEWVIRQELFADPAESDNAFFSQRCIADHRALHARDPIARGTIDVGARDRLVRDRLIRTREYAEVDFRPDADRGEWWLWVDPEQVVSWRAQGKPVVMGVDLGYGVGSSNTVFWAASADTGEQLAEFVSPGVTPEQAARLSCVAGLWFGGNKCAMIAPERNGPGESYIKALRELGWPLIWQDRKDASVMNDAPVQEYGWWSDHSSKRILLSDFRQGMQTRMVVRSGRTLDECGTYREDERGRVLSDYEAGMGQSEEAARVPHGDRVIAAALCWMAMQEAPRSVGTVDEPSPHTPQGRWEARVKARAAKVSGW